MSINERPSRTGIEKQSGFVKPQETIVHQSPVIELRNGYRGRGEGDHLLATYGVAAQRH